MRTKFKFLIVSITMLFFFTSCNEDLYENQIPQTESKFNIRKLNHSEIYKNNKVAQKLGQIQKFKSKLANSRVVYDPIYDFFINTDEALYIADGVSESFTFPIYRASETTVLENLVIHVEENQILTYLVDYGHPLNELQNMTQQQLEQNVVKHYLIDFNTSNVLSNRVAMAQYVCFQSYVWDPSIPCNEGELVGAGQGIYCGGWVVQSSYCQWVYDTSNGGSLNGTPDETEDISDGVGNTGNGAISNSTINTSFVGCLNCPDISLELEEFLSNMGVENSEWFNDFSNINEQLLMINYLESNNYSLEATNFINNLINEIINNENNVNPLPSDTILEINTPLNRINNINDYLKCFNLGQSASFTIYVDQPTPNSNKAWSGSPLDPNVGHTFIAIRQGGIRRVLGYYPASAVDISDPSSPGSFENDSSHEYDVALSVNITPSQLLSLINYIKSKESSIYNLNTFNCSDFGMGASTIIGMPLGSAYGSWGVGAGDNPGQLGQNIRNMPTPSGATKVTTTGVAASNTGTCN